MQLPRILKSFNVFTDGLNKDGVLMTVKRPDIKFKTEDYTPGGGMGEFTVIHGIEKLELELTSKGFDLELFKSISHKINGNLLRYQGALHKEDEETYQTLVGEARGRIIETTRSEDKAAEGGEQTFKYALTYWKETVDGEVVFEADLMANKLIIEAGDAHSAADIDPDDLNSWMAEIRDSIDARRAINLAWMPTQAPAFLRKLWSRPVLLAAANRHAGSPLSVEELAILKRSGDKPFTIANHGRGSTAFCPLRVLTVGNRN